MLHRLKLSIVLQGLTLFLLGPACEASSLGMTVHVVPLDSDGGKTVRAHFTAIVPEPCPDLTGLCATGEDCLVHATSLPFNGSKPDGGWCVRQWQKTVASNYTGNITLGSNTEFYVAIKAEPKVRANSGRLNQPAFVALPPPLRARVNCPHHFHLSVKDLDRDKVRCRFARPDEGECLGCTQHSFIELDKEKCMVTFTGKAQAGRYLIHLMAEDLVPVPKISHVTDNQPLSSVPVHLSLTVEESTTSCSDEPVATGDTPEEDLMVSVLPYDEIDFKIQFFSELESVIEVAVVGPPKLYRTALKSVGPLAMMTMGWVRSENELARLLPICFAVNTESMQSEPRCVWLNQVEMMSLPSGTELTCENTEMTLVLPVSSLTNINLDELQLNNPTCPVTYNDTYLTARISLDGCGTKIVHSGSELVYTNTLQSVRTYTVVSRKPSLILPLACRIPAVQANGPHHKIGMPTERETFGELEVWIEIHMEGEGPLSKFTRNPQLRALRRLPLRKRRDVESPSGNTTISISNSTTPTVSSFTSPNISSNTTSSISSNTTSSTSSNTTSSLSSNTTSSISSNTTSSISSNTTSSLSSNTTSSISSNTTSSLSSNTNSSISSNTTSTSNSSSGGLAIGSRIDKLDLYVMSNCSIDRAEMMVSNCIESETEDFAVSHPILQQGCTASEGTFEIITTQSNFRIYRLDLSSMETNGTTMYIRCTVNLCIATMPSEKCPTMCTRSTQQRSTVSSVYTRTYTISSGPISMVVTTPAPTMSTVATSATNTSITTSSIDATGSSATTTSHAPTQVSTTVGGVLFAVISIFLQTIFLD